MEQNREEENGMPCEFVFDQGELASHYQPQKDKNNVSRTSSSRACHARRTKLIKSRRPVKGAKQRKIDQMAKRIHQLETEIQILKGKNFCDRCRSTFDGAISLSRAFSQKCSIREQKEQKQPAKLPQPNSLDLPYLQFEQFEVEGMTPTPEIEQMDLSGQIWIVMGLLMMVMGININGFDGTIDVYKITRQTVDYVRKQVEKSAETVVLPVFFSKVFSLEGSLGITNQINNEGFELEGLRLQSIEENELMFEQHLNFHLKYEALIVMMEYMKQYACIK